MEHDDIYKWIKQNREHFDLSDSVNDNMNDNTHETSSRGIQGRDKILSHS